MLGLAITTVMTHAVLTASPADQGMDARAEWASFKLLGTAAEPDATARIEVLANNDPVQSNARHGKPMNIAGAAYTRGLYCHAVSDVVVHLPGPAARFDAVVGVDTNEQTSGGRGSVVFSVSAGGVKVWESPLMREGMAGVPVSVDLKGVSEFRLHVSDGGDGISCDQSDWADAKVTLADGTEVWLGDLPLSQDAAVPLTDEPFFSFTYDGVSSRTFLDSWKLSRESHRIDDARTGHTLTYTDPATGLVVRCEAVEYADFPTIEWTLYLKNTGTADTPIISGIQAIDTVFGRGGEGEFVLHHHKGDGLESAGYEPLTSTLGADTTSRFAPTGGRPTDEAWPYFNVAWPGGGLVYALGWPGQWAAEFTRDGGRGLRIRGGQELTHFKLLPGEEVRTPLVVLQFYQGDWVDAQNVWRRWVMAHSMPRPNGAPPESMLLAASSRAYNEMIDANEQNQIMFIDRYLEEKLGLDYWWMDAGWYPCDRSWPKTGTWEIDTTRFPNGFKPITDHAHANGLKVVVWFEPERVQAGTWLTEQHPEWVHGGANGGLLRLDKPEVLEWLTEHVDKLITEQGIDLYRQDFNMRPLDSWRANDAEDRQGITEIRHVTNYLAYFDELRRRHPGMLIDTCASGGRRLDIETYRRAVPLWRSDYVFVPLGMQCLTYGLSLWLPFHGTGTVACANAGYYGGGATPVEAYAFWSNMANSCSCGVDLREKGIDYDALRALFGQWREASPNYYGDFYPLMPHSRSEDAWMAWQFNRAGQGMVQAFRRKESVYESARLPLRGLDADATYRLRAVDETETREATGRELMERGLLVGLPECPQATTILYERVK